MRKRLNLSDQVRSAIRCCGRSQYRIAKEAGVDRGALSRFLTGERGLTSESLDRLTDYLGLALCPRADR